MDTKHIIDCIERYAASTGLAPATITSRAAGNSKLYDRLKSGGSCTLRIANKLLEYISENPPAAPHSEGAS